MAPDGSMQCPASPGNVAAPGAFLGLRLIILALIRRPFAATATSLRHIIVGESKWNIRNHGRRHGGTAQLHGGCCVVQRTGLLLELATTCVQLTSSFNSVRNNAQLNTNQLPAASKFGSVPPCFPPTNNGDFTSVTSVALWSALCETAALPECPGFAESAFRFSEKKQRCFPNALASENQLSDFQKPASHKGICRDAMVRSAGTFSASDQTRKAHMSLVVTIMSHVIKLIHSSSSCTASLASYFRSGAGPCDLWNMTDQGSPDRLPAMPS